MGTNPHEGNSATNLINRLGQRIPTIIASDIVRERPSFQRGIRGTLRRISSSLGRRVDHALLERELETRSNRDSYFSGEQQNQIQELLRRVVEFMKIDSTKNDNLQKRYRYYLGRENRSFVKFGQSAAGQGFDNKTIQLDIDIAPQQLLSHLQKRIVTSRMLDTVPQAELLSEEGPKSRSEKFGLKLNDSVVLWCRRDSNEVGHFVFNIEIIDVNDELANNRATFIEGLTSTLQDQPRITELLHTTTINGIKYNWSNADLIINEPGSQIDWFTADEVSIIAGKDIDPEQKSVVFRQVGPYTLRFIHKYSGIYSLSVTVEEEFRRQERQIYLKELVPVFSQELETGIGLNTDETNPFVAILTNREWQFGRFNRDPRGYGQLGSFEELRHPGLTSKSDMDYGGGLKKYHDSDIKMFMINEMREILPPEVLALIDNNLQIDNFQEWVAGKSWRRNITINGKEFPLIIECQIAFDRSYKSEAFLTMRIWKSDHAQYVHNYKNPRVRQNDEGEPDEYSIRSAVDEALRENFPDNNLIIEIRRERPLRGKNEQYILTVRQEQ